MWEVRNFIEDIIRDVDSSSNPFGREGPSFIGIIFENIVLYVHILNGINVKIETNLLTHYL